MVTYFLPPRGLVSFRPHSWDPHKKGTKMLHSHQSGHVDRSGLTSAQHSASLGRHVDIHYTGGLAGTADNRRGCYKSGGGALGQSPDGLIKAHRTTACKSSVLRSPRSSCYLCCWGPGRGTPRRARQDAGTWRQGTVRGPRTPEDLAATPDFACPSSQRGK